MREFSDSTYLAADGTIDANTIFISKILIVPDGGSGDITIKAGGSSGTTKLYFKAHERGRVIDFKKPLRIEGSVYGDVTDAKVTVVYEK